MKEIVERLTENRNIERAKQIMESAGYKVTKKRVSEYLSIPYSKDDIQPMMYSKSASEDLQDLLSKFRALGYKKTLYKPHKYEEGADYDFMIEPGKYIDRDKIYSLLDSDCEFLEEVPEKIPSALKEFRKYYEYNGHKLYIEFSHQRDGSIFTDGAIFFILDKEN